MSSGSALASLAAKSGQMFWCRFLDSHDPVDIGSFVAGDHTVLEKTHFLSLAFVDRNATL
jgi:hypothetical protein